MPAIVFTSGTNIPDGPWIIDNDGRVIRPCVGDPRIEEALAALQGLLKGQTKIEGESA